MALLKFPPFDPKFDDDDDEGLDKSVSTVSLVSIPGNSASAKAILCCEVPCDEERKSGKVRATRAAPDTPSDEVKILPSLCEAIRLF